MLNYIWFGLLAVGILVAAGKDISDEATDRFHNGDSLAVHILLSSAAEAPLSRLDGKLMLASQEFGEFYGIPAETLRLQPITITLLSSDEGTFTLPITDLSPKIWKEMVKGAANKDYLTGRIVPFQGDKTFTHALLVFEPIHYIKMKAITQAALDIAGVAVTLAFGLIGIMALWLGVMKVAEEAGLLKVVARVLSPVMKRLFPDVPADHPAVGAMIMNIAANMLGLNNAATPLGLKAMEELDKLNPNPGTATNAMVTFLAINTGGLILIPATAIAVRASVGSSNPGIIIGTSIVGAGCATVAGILAAKLLQRLPYFKKDVTVKALPTDEVKRG